MPKKIRNTKAKGTVAENELIHKFWENDWVAVRVAGSGSTRYPSPDIIASCTFGKVVMEIKVVNDTKKYFPQQEINDLNYFANQFGAQSWIGVKFKENQWYFLPTSELEMTRENNYSTTLIKMKRTGFTFDEMNDMIKEISIDQNQ